MSIRVTIGGLSRDLMNTDRIKILESRILYAMTKLENVNSDDIQIIADYRPTWNFETLGKFNSYSECATNYSVKEAGPSRIFDSVKLPNALQDANSEHAKQYSARNPEPSWNFERLKLPVATLQELIMTLNIIGNEKELFDEWGLREIEPYPRTALNLFGPPGTGKTFAAHAIANKTNKKLICATHADLESKYLGEGSKNIEALFFAAEQSNAVLFIDEADSLLSKRITNITQGSEQAINSMRSQLLICLEKFRGIVIFATNLISNYDNAFETRVRHIAFDLPDASCRSKIWESHLIHSIPKKSDINIEQLSFSSEGFCGREIKNAVMEACLLARNKGKKEICQQDLLDAVTKILKSKQILRDLKKQDNPPHNNIEDIQKKVKDHISKHEI